MEPATSEMLGKTNGIPYAHALIKQSSSNNVFDPISEDYSLDEVYDFDSDAMDIDKHHKRVSCYSSIDYSQPSSSLLCTLPSSVILEIFQYVDQFDLVSLLVVCKKFYSLAIERLYKRVTVVLNAEFPVRFGDDSKAFIKETGIKYMNSALILKLKCLKKFFETIQNNDKLLNKIKFFIFDKCNPVNIEKIPIGSIQYNMIDYFGAKSHEIQFLHITFMDFQYGVTRLTNFLQMPNVRNKVFKLFATQLSHLYTPMTPQSLVNLFLMVEDGELALSNGIDLSSPNFQCFNSLFTLTCSTLNHLGLEILSKIKLISPNQKLNLRGLTIFHCHKEGIRDTFGEPPIYERLYTAEDGFQTYFEQLDKKLDFKKIDDKINIANLSSLYLKVDCNEHRNNNCNCFSQFFNDLTKYSLKHDGLPNLKSFELELFPNLEWLRPHQILENNLTPLSTFLTSLRSLTSLTIDLSTPGFKMFDNSMGMTTMILNRLNERLMEAFFLRFFTSPYNTSRLKLKTLQLPDFLTSFIYYKPYFYESFLHTCTCWGCQILLDKLKDEFFPLRDNDDLEEDGEIDLQSAYYILIGFILGKLQADRELCVPIKQKTVDFRNYPLYKGSSHILHDQFHTNRCSCKIEEDLYGKDEMNIDNLVTTYIVHQLRPIVSFLTQFFTNLDNLMIHGIYYERQQLGIMVPIFDQDEYPQEHLNLRTKEIRSGQKPDIPFGKFR